MTTLRVRLAAQPLPDRADQWALFDATGRCARTGTDHPAAWPSADRIEAVIAASQVRIATVKLPPMAASRVAGAAGFALEDQLAGAPADHHLGVTAQAPDGRVGVIVVARSLVAAIVAGERRITRIIAEPELAAPIAGWRWCADESGSGFVRCSDGSAFPVDAPSVDGALPAELALALARSQRDGAAPAQLRIDAPIGDAALARLQREAGVAVVRGTPWHWHGASAASFASALDLRPVAPATAAAAPQRSLGRAFAPALALLGAALAIHVVASAGEWAALRIDAWRSAHEWTDLAVAAGVPPDAATTPQAARAALARRYALLRHAQGLPAPDDALPLLARATAALAALPPGTVKSAAYADGHWTLELARADPAVIGDLDARMRAVRVPMLVATSANGARVRIGGP